MITYLRGGEGAVREVCDKIIVAQGRQESCLRNYLADLQRSLGPEEPGLVTHGRMTTAFAGQ